MEGSMMREKNPTNLNCFAKVSIASVSLCRPCTTFLMSQTVPVHQRWRELLGSSAIRGSKLAKHLGTADSHSTSCPLTEVISQSAQYNLCDLEKM
jgi:hypothetical protein